MAGKRGNPNFKRGMKKPPNSGRRKGVPSLKSASVMEALDLAFQGMGGWEKLMEWGQKRPDLFYPLWIKLLPSKIEAKTDNTNTNKTEFDWSKIPLDKREKLLDLCSRIASGNGFVRPDEVGEVSQS